MKFKLSVEYEAKDEEDAEKIAQEITANIYAIPTDYRMLGGRNEDEEERTMYFIFGKTVEVFGPVKE